MARKHRRRFAKKDNDIRPNATGPDYLLVGQILKPHGIQGEIAMRVITEHPERLPQLDTLYVEGTPYTIKSVRPHRERLLLQFEEIADRDEAAMLRQRMVYIHVDDAIPLEDGEYYIYELQGIKVITDDGQHLGHLTDFIETGANDVYEITQSDGKKILLPAIPSVILSVDIDEHIMTVHLLEGLLD